jgi:hypothetical protein
VFFLFLVGFAGLQFYRGGVGSSSLGDRFQSLVVVVASFLLVAALYRRASRLAVENPVESWHIGPMPGRSLVVRLPFVGVVLYLLFVGSEFLDPIPAGIAVVVALLLAALMIRQQSRDERTLVVTDAGLVVETEGNQLSGFMPWWRVRGVTLGDSYLKVRDLAFVDSVRIERSQLNDPQTVATRLRDYVGER